MFARNIGRLGNRAIIDLSAARLNKRYYNDCILDICISGKQGIGACIETPFFRASINFFILLKETNVWTLGDR
jgi:hypothetical protein